jgi:hypothetical protein
MPARPLELTVDQQQLAAIAKAMKADTAAKDLRRELLRNLKAAAAPAVKDAKSAIASMPSQGLTQGESLRQGIARQIKPVVRLTGQRTGVTIQVGRTPNLRGFGMAGQRTNRKSFRHRVYGRQVWVAQNGKYMWFDATMGSHRAEFRTSVLDAVQAMADQMAARARSGS